MGRVGARLAAPDNAAGWTGPGTAWRTLRRGGAGRSGHFCPDRDSRGNRFRQGIDASLELGRIVRLLVARLQLRDDELVSGDLELGLPARPGFQREDELGRGLRKSHRQRMQNLNVYNRGNRDWTSREKVGKIARVVQGESWTMEFAHDVANDLRSVQQYLSISAA